MLPLPWPPSLGVQAPGFGSSLGGTRLGISHVRVAKPSGPQVTRARPEGAAPGSDVLHRSGSPGPAPYCLSGWKDRGTPVGSPMHSHTPSAAKSTESRFDTPLRSSIPPSVLRPQPPKWGPSALAPTPAAGYGGYPGSQVRLLPDSRSLLRSDSIRGGAMSVPYGGVRMGPATPARPSSPAVELCSEPTLNPLGLEEMEAAMGPGVPARAEKEDAGAETADARSDGSEQTLAEARKRTEGADPKLARELELLQQQVRDLERDLHESKRSCAEYKARCTKYEQLHGIALAEGGGLK